MENYIKNISSEEFNKIKKKEIGRGRDGIVYSLGNGYVIKIYHVLNNKWKLYNSKIIDDEDIKIYSKENKIPFNNVQNPFSFYNQDTKLYTKDAILSAVSKSKNIKRSNLPSQLVFIDGNFAGCVYKKLTGLGIHRLKEMPISYKKKIIKNVIADVSELIDNFVYPIDVDNNPQVGHSNIFVNPITKKTKIIDLDGLSTVYSQNRNLEYEYKSLQSLSNLILEFMIPTINISEIYDNGAINIEPSEMLTYLLKEAGVEDFYVEKFVSRQITIDDLNDFIENYHKKV